MAKKTKKKGHGGATIALNKKAKHEYFIQERYEAGISLEGWEVKSLRAGRISLAFLCDGPDEVDRVYDAIRDAGHGVERPPFDAFWGQRYATVLDPDGNSVDLFAAVGG